MVTTPVHFTWDDSYIVGIDVLDAQHRHLCELVDNVQTALCHRGPRTELSRAVADLLIFSETHFAYEEQLLLCARFPDISNHVSQHRRLLERIQRLHRAVQDEDTLSATESLSALLASLDEHLAGADRKYGEFVRDGGEDVS